MPEGQYTDCLNNAVAKSDFELVQRIATARDRTAFDELFNRYRDSAYSLAWHLLQNSALAEESVQEAMLAVWLSPRTQFENRTPRDWILGTVAGKSLNIRRGQKKQSRREKVVVQHKATAAHSSDPVESGELLTALRQHIEQLPEQESALLACRFGANLSHQKIGELLGIPRGTISLRIQQAVDRLRLSLRQGGLAALMPLAGSETIRHALTTGYVCPGGPLPAAGAARAVSHASSARIKRVRRRVSTGKPATAPWFALAAVLTAGVLLTAILASRPADAAPRSSSPPPVVMPAETQQSALPPVPPPLTAVVTPAAPIQPKKFYKRWTFEKAPADLRVIEGGWTWKPQGTSGCMLCEDSVSTYVILPIEIAAQPFKVTLTRTPYRGKDLLTGTIVIPWTQGNSCANEVWSQTSRIIPEERALTVSTVMNGSYALGYDEYGVLRVVEKCPPAKAGTKICLYLKSIELQEIVVESIDVAELPSEFQQVDAVIDRLAAAGCGHGILRKSLSK